MVDVKSQVIDVKKMILSALNKEKSASGHFKSSSKLQSLRLRVLMRDSFQCVGCGSKENLTINHIVPLSSNPFFIKKIKQGVSPRHIRVRKRIWGEFGNLETLCYFCHRKKNNYGALDQYIS